MNKKLIFSLALLACVSNNSYARIPYQKLILLGGVAVTGIRAAWHTNNSPYKDFEQKGSDVALALVQDLGTLTTKAGEELITGEKLKVVASVLEVMGEKLIKGGEWIKKEANDARANIPEPQLGSLNHNPFKEQLIKDSSKTDL